MTENNLEMWILTDNNIQDNHSGIKKLGWCQLLTKFGKRSTSIENGCLICLCALNVHFNYIFNNTSSDIKKLFGSSYYLLWYLGAIVGCIICGSNSNPWPTKNANKIMAFSLLLAGILICLDNSVWDDVWSLIAIARFIAGSCFGFAYITTIIQISDNIWKDIRGYMSTTLAIIPLFAHLIAIVKPDIDTDDDRGDETIQHNTMPNILMMTLIILTILNTFKPTSEPLVVILKSANIHEAQKTLTELWKNLIDPKVIDDNINDKVKMLSEDFKETLHFSEIFENGNWRTIRSMLQLKLLEVFTSNLFLYRLSIMSSEVFRETSVVLFIIIMRFLAILPARYGSDKLGRKRILLFSGLSTGCISLFLIFTSNDLIFITFVLMHIFACGIEPIVHTYTTEAFPLSKRNASIAFVTCFGYICEGLVMLLWSINESLVNGFMLYSMPFMLISMTSVTYFVLPETMGMSVSQCWAEFNEYHKTPSD